MNEGQPHCHSPLLCSVLRPPVCWPHHLPVSSSLAVTMLTFPYTTTTVGAPGACFSAFPWTIRCLKAPKQTARDQSPSLYVINNFQTALFIKLIEHWQATNASMHTYTHTPFHDGDCKSSRLPMFYTIQVTISC